MKSALTLRLGGGGRDEAPLTPFVDGVAPEETVRCLGGGGASPEDGRGGGEGDGV